MPIEDQVDAVGVVQSLGILGRASEELISTAEGAIRRCGAALDGTLPPMRAPPSPDTGANEPCVLARAGSVHLLWKPQGWTAPSGRAPEMRRWLAERFRDHPIVADAAASYGLVHRLDRYTSGSLLWAGGYEGFYLARFEFAVNRVRKAYCCILRGSLSQGPHFWDVPLLEVPNAGYTKSIPDRLGRPAATEVVSVSHILDPGKAAASLVEIALHTGRMHQIRAHAADAGYPLVGDPVYGEISEEAWCSRLFLHAWAITINLAGETLSAQLPLPDSFQSALDASLALCPRDRARMRHWAELRRVV